MNSQGSLALERLIILQSLYSLVVEISHEAKVL